MTAIPDKETKIAWAWSPATVLAVVDLVGLAHPAAEIVATMNPTALQSIIAQVESSTLEFKRSTAELKRVGETICAFLNGDGGKDNDDAGAGDPAVGPHERRIVGVRHHADRSSIAGKNLLALLAVLGPPALSPRSASMEAHGTVALGTAVTKTAGTSMPSPTLAEMVANGAQMTTQGS